MLDNKSNLFDLEIKKESNELDKDLTAQSLGPAIKATRSVCPKVTRGITVTCQGKNGCK